MLRVHRCLFVSLCALLLSSSLYAADRPAPGVIVEQVEAVNLPRVVEYPARTAGYREVQVRAQVGGILQERVYDEGSQVEKGQLLFRIDPRPYQAALGQAKGALAQAQARYWQTERDLGRIRKLQAKGFASESELDNAISNFEQSRANIEAAKAEVQARQIDLDYTEVKAPIDGVTGTEAVSEGSLIVAGDPSSSLLTHITQLDPIYVNFAAPDVSVERLRSELASGVLVPSPGQKMQVEVLFADGSAYPHTGTLDFTGSLINQGTGTVSARGLVPNPENSLIPGQFVRVLVKGLTRLNTITVPERAIAQSNQGTFVYLVDADGIAKVQPVVTGDTIGDRWIITSGLKAGDQVVVEGLSKLAPNTPVRIEQKLPTPPVDKQE